MFCIYPMSHCSATKKKEIINFARKWIELKNVKLVVEPKTQGQIFSVLSHLRFLAPNLQVGVYELE